MKNLDKYFFKPRKAEEIVDKALIVIDTNILLAAYQWKKASFKEITNIMDNLMKEERLKIPSHVFEEFMDQRPNRIKEIV
ncbi:hypothetical protein FLK61_40240 [Paenalkalicoccus suaedae]|uniref:PIN like domain-containing protein n=1 Tax=Paenalkalicoccus suaedae TaxID=2592382 RepID=A0A859FIU4_9BACI|nr:hypothetical protein FLK61_40240 [Paenalkalicoccus suaedae]